MSKLSGCLVVVVAVLLAWVWSLAPAAQDASFAGQDLHLSGKTMRVSRSADPAEKHILIFEDGMTMRLGDNQLSSDKAVVLITRLQSEHRGIQQTDYDVRVYLEHNVTVIQGKSARTSGVDNTVLNRGQALVARFLVTGEVFAEAETQTVASDAEIRKIELCERALTAAAPIRSEPYIRKEAQVPPFERPVMVAKASKSKPWSPLGMFEPLPGGEEQPAPPVEPAPQEPPVEYPVSIAGLWEPAPKIQNADMGDGRFAATVMGRFYLWQKRDDRGGLIEFQADNAVIFHAEPKFGEESKSRSDGVLASGRVSAIYVRGNIVMTEGPRTIRAHEMYYDFKNHRGFAIQAELRTFDPKRELPIYLRAQELRQVSESMFEADQITLTTSEFYLPQISMNASRMVLTDTTNIDSRTQAGPDKKSFEGTLYDVDMKLGSATIFRWPKLQTDFVRPDVPIRRLQFGSDSQYGTTVMTQWHLARLLGWKEPKGMDTNLAVDYYSDRGVGVGVESEYQFDKSYGELIGYVMTDRGTDDLGRVSSRKNVDSGEDVRGRFSLRHRMYLPYDWQLTVEVGYLSDENFLEWMYQDEFNTGKPQETLVHLKRIRDNWGFSFLNKVRINDFETMTEELPTAEFHWAGESFWDDQLTFYSDTQASRMRFRNGHEHYFNPNNKPVSDWDRSQPEDFYTFITTRNEVDMPMRVYNAKVVPYVAGTYSYEDQMGYRTELDDTPAGTHGEDQVTLGEVGVRASTQFWKADPFVQSRFWDINGLRHVVTPHVEAAAFEASDEASDMRDLVNFGLSQRWQTRRGPQEKLHTVDWIRWDVDTTLVSQNADPMVGPWDLAWTNPSIPMAVRRSVGEYGFMRDSVSSDFEWRLSDTTTILSDMMYDIRSGYVQQLNVGVSRYVFPDLSYYVGSRYLRNVVVDVSAANNGGKAIHEEGSHALVTAVAYNLNERYTAIVSQEYNFDYEQSIRNEVTLLRRYHRIFYGLSYSMDAMRDRQSIMFSIWPQGVKELTIGSRRYYGATGPLREE
jgi:hypothetical protein